MKFLVFRLLFVVFGLVASAALAQTTTTVELVNNTGQAVDIVWINQGARQTLGTIPPGATTPMNTTVGHEFEFMAGGAVLSHHVVAGTPGERFFAETGAAQAQPSAPVAAAPALDGQTLRMVDIGTSAFVQTGLQEWAEVEKASGQTTNRFQETFRSPSEVKLFDPSRRLHLSFLLTANQVWLAPDGSPLQPQWNIVASSDQSLIPGMNVQWDAAAAPAPPQQPQQQAAAAPPEQACFDSIQNKVAWSRNGDTQWDPNNVRALCQGVADYAARVGCFQNGIAAHDDWQRALRECQGVGALAGASPAAPQQQAAQPQSQSQPEPQAQPQPTSVELVNNTGQAVDIVWVNQGARQTLGTIPPGATTPMNTTVGDEFEFMAGGAVLSHHVVAGTPGERFFAQQGQVATVQPQQQPPPQQPQQPQTGAQTAQTIPTTSQFPGVTGHSVRMVQYESGAVVQTDPDRWIDIKAGSSELNSVFNLTRRGETWVELYDPSRKARIYLSLGTKEILFMPDGGQAQPVYTIRAAANESVIPGDPKQWDMFKYAHSRRGWRPPSGPAFLKDAETFDDPNFNLLIMRLTIGVTSTTDEGEDEVFITVIDQSGTMTRIPETGTRSMNEDDPDLESWTVEVPIKISKNDELKKTLPVPVYIWEEDDGQNDDDIVATYVIDLENKRLNGSAIQGYQVAYGFIDRSIDVNSTRIEAVELSPQVRDLVSLLEKIEAGAGLIHETEFPDYLARYNSNDEIQNHDHPNGITLTQSGRLVINMALHKPAECPTVMYSDSIFSRSADQLKWTYLDKLDPTSASSTCLITSLIFDDTVNRYQLHPSAMQAVGEVVAIANNPVRFIYLPTVGDKVSVLDHLTQDIRNTDANGREAVGIAYHKKEHRFFSYWSANGGVTDKVAEARQQIDIYATDRGLSLLDDGTRFRKVATVSNVWLSGQGANLITDSNGDVFVVSFFSSDNEPATEIYAPVCALELLPAEVGAVAATGAVVAAAPFAPWLAIGALLYHSVEAAVVAAEYPFTDILAVSKIGTYDEATRKVDFMPRAEDILHKEVGRTQGDQPCVIYRPAWRFAGGIVPLSESEILALWSGRYNYLLLDAINDYEFQVQRISNN